MSTPLALIVKVPELADEEPAGEGLPMSCASQGAGTAACAAPPTEHIARAKTDARTERSVLTCICTRSPSRSHKSARSSRTFNEEAHLRPNTRCDAPAVFDRGTARKLCGRLSGVRGL